MGSYKKEEYYDSKNIESLKEHYSKVLELIGFEKQSSLTTTSAFSGVFLESEKTRLEFMNLIR